MSHIKYWQEPNFKAARIRIQDCFSDVRGARFAATKVKNPERITFSQYLRKYFQNKRIGKLT